MVWCSSSASTSPCISLALAVRQHQASMMRDPLYEYSTLKSAPTSHGKICICPFRDSEHALVARVLFLLQSFFHFKVVSVFLFLHHCAHDTRAKDSWPGHIQTSDVGAF